MRSDRPCTVCSTPNLAFLHCLLHTKSRFSSLSAPHEISLFFTVCSTPNLAFLHCLLLFHAFLHSLPSSQGARQTANSLQHVCQQLKLQLIHYYLPKQKYYKVFDYMAKDKKNGTTNGHHANGNANGTTANTTAPALLTVDARNYVPNLVADDQRMRELAEYGLDYAHSIGLYGRTVEHKFQSDIASAPPLALMPSPFPRSLFKKAFEVQETLNELYFRISCDHEFLIEAYKDVIKQIHDEEVNQPLALSVQHADYLSHWDEQKQCIELKQVEVNIGQIGGPGFATQTNKYHRKMLDKLAIVRAGTGGMEMLAHTEMPVNKPRHKMGRTLYEACDPIDFQGVRGTLPS
ncbi:hypothetical protein niasHS_009004 [Heterodera schachtii]|uniref:Glutathione synthetase n=2 Tax=Heterodera TaxID=34509 RepID=A0ABD2J3D3_HETSC